MDCLVMAFWMMGDTFSAFENPHNDPRALFRLKVRRQDRTIQKARFNGQEWYEPCIMVPSDLRAKKKYIRNKLY
jgi:hypothetical protein